MSLFSGLDIAARGLNASQIAINVIGQNITNASDPNYSRKRIEQSSDWRRDGSFGQMGFGVQVYTINRIRDQFIDRLVNEEATRYGYYEMKSRAFDRIESIFAEPRDHALNSLLNEFWNGWAEVANDPAKAGPREALRSTTESLVTQFNYISTELRSYKTTINDEIEARVIRINEITSSIYRCNTVIAASENAIGHKANDTRDQRDALLKELAQLVDVDYFEDDRGALIVSTNGHILVSGAKSHDLLMRRTDVMEQDGYQYSKVEVSFALTGSEFKPKHGELRALMDIRDIDVPKYEEYINSVAQSLITEVNKVHQNGYSLSGLTFIEFFDSDPSKFSAAGIQLSAAVKKDINNIAAGVGGKVTPSNNLFDIPQLTPDPPGNVQVLDLTTIDEHYRYIHKNSLVIKDIDGNLLQEGKDYDINYFTAQITFKYSATNAFGEASNQISVSFDYSQTGYGGPGDGDNALAISQLRDKALMQSDVFGNSTQTINQFYSGMLGRLGVERNEAEAGLDTRTFALQQLLEQQQQIMGVNIDEEMANMIRYEHTYVASARYLSTINSMLDTLLNM